MQSRFSNDTKQGPKIIQSLFNILLSFAHQAWLLRNSAQHGSTPTFLQNKVRYRLLPRLDAIYAVKHKLLASDQVYFDIEKSTVALLPPTNLESWLTQAEIFIKGALQREKTHTRLNTRPLNHYFPIRSNTRNNPSMALRALTHLSVQISQTTKPTHSRTTVSQQRQQTLAQPTISTFLSTQARQTAIAHTTNTQTEIQTTNPVQNNRNIPRPSIPPTHSQSTNTLTTLAATIVTKSRKAQTQISSFFTKNSGKLTLSNFKPP